MARDSVLSIDNASRTLITFEPAADLSTNQGPYDFSQGMLTSPTDGTISVANSIPGKTVVLISGFVEWAANSSGFREVRLVSGSGGATHFGAATAISNGATVVTFSVLKEMVVDDDTFHITGWQNSGAALNIVLAVFGVARIR